MFGTFYISNKELMEDFYQIMRVFLRKINLNNESEKMIISQYHQKLISTFIKLVIHFITLIILLDFL